MAKFNKDEFKASIKDAVESAILKGLITKEDIENKDEDRLNGFIMYQLTQALEDRKWCVDVLKDFNYDEKASWDRLQEKYGKFRSLADVALINLWKFLENEGVTSYDSYEGVMRNALSKGDDTLLGRIAADSDVKADADVKRPKRFGPDIDNDDHDAYTDESWSPRTIRR